MKADVLLQMSGLPFEAPFLGGASPIVADATPYGLVTNIGERSAGRFVPFDEQDVRAWDLT